MKLLPQLITKIKNGLQQILGNESYGFLSHSKNYISAQLFTQGLSIITIPIFTRLLLPEDYGVLAILSSFIAIFSIFYGLSVQGSIVRYYYEGSNDFNKFLGSILAMIVIWGSLFTLLLFIFNRQLQTFFQIPTLVINIGIFIGFFKVFFTLYQSFLQASKRSKRVALLTIIQRIAGILISVFLILQMQDEKYYGRAYSMLIIALLMCFYSLYHLRKKIIVNFNMKYLKYSLLFSLPVVFHLLSQYALTSFDQVIINQLVGEAETGLYSLAYNIGMLQLMITTGMLTAWSPIFYEKLNNRKYNDIKRLASLYSRLIYILAFSLILFSREIVMVLADKAYYSALDIVPIIIISYVLNFFYFMYIDFAFYYKKTYLIDIFTIIAGAINVGLNYWLIPIFGYKVAAWSTLVAYACLFLLHYVNVRFIIKPEWITKLRILLPNFFILLGFVFGFYFLAKDIQSFFILFAIKIFLLCILTIIYFYKQIISRLGYC